MTHDELIDEIAIALQMDNLGGASFYDATDGCVIPVLDEAMDEAAELDRFPEWEKDMVLTFRTHELIKIDPVPSWQAFQIMEDFVEQCSDGRVQEELYQALNRKHPFSAFKRTAERIGVIDAWYAYKGQAYHQLAVDWLKENHLPF